MSFVPLFISNTTVQLQCFGVFTEQTATYNLAWSVFLLLFLPSISRQQTIFLRDLRFLVQWFDVQSIWDCGALQSAVCLGEGLAAASVFLLGATRHFDLFSCKICAEIAVHQMFAVSLNGLNVKYCTEQFFFGLFVLFSVSRLVIASILLSHRLLSRESGLYKVT